VLDNKDVAIRALGGVVTILYSSGRPSADPPSRPLIDKLFEGEDEKNGDV